MSIINTALVRETLLSCAEGTAEEVESYIKAFLGDLGDDWNDHFADADEAIEDFKLFLAVDREERLAK